MSDYSETYKRTIPHTLALLMLVAALTLLGWPLSFLWGVLAGVVLFHASIGFTGMWQDYRSEE